MKRKIIVTLCVIAVLLLLGLSCPGCGDPTANSKSDSLAKAAVKTGDIKTEVAPEINVSAVDIKGDTITNVEGMTFAQLIWDIYSDILFRIAVVIFFIMWYTGNLHPSKNFSLWDKR